MSNINMESFFEKYIARFGPFEMEKSISELSITRDLVCIIPHDDFIHYVISLRNKYGGTLEVMAVSVW